MEFSRGKNGKDVIIVPRGEMAIGKRQVEILQCLADGLQMKEIAHSMGTSIETVKVYAHYLYAKIGVHNAHGAVGFGFRNGIVK